MLIVAAGFAGLNHSMSGGASAHYMRVGLLFYIIGATVVVGESALNIGLAEAASDGNQAVAEALYAASGAIGSTGEAARFLGFALIGVSIFTQKNLHVALGALMVVIGLIGVGVAVSDYNFPPDGDRVHRRGHTDPRHGDSGHQGQRLKGPILAGHDL